MEGNISTTFGGNWTAFASIIDLGSIVNVRILNDKTAFADLRFEHFFTPGIGLYYNWLQTPATMGVHYSCIPNLRNIVIEDEGATVTESGVSVSRFNFSVLIDIPFFIPAGNRDTTAVGHDQQVGGFTSFSVLVCAAFSRPLHQAVRAVQVQSLHVQPVFLDPQISGEHVMEHAHPAPFSVMVINRLPAERRIKPLNINKQQAPLATRFQFMDDAPENIPGVEPTGETPSVNRNKRFDAVFHFVFL